MHLIHNTFHYVDMTGGITFLSSEILSMRLHESAECVRDLRSMFFFLNGYPILTLDIFVNVMTQLFTFSL